MNSICFRYIVFAGLCVLTNGIITLPATGQTSEQTGDALEQTNLTWNSIGWTVGAPARGRPDALIGTCPVEAPGPLLRTTIAGPAKLVFDWTVQAASEGAVLGLSVDGHELALDTPYQAWRCVELQIPAGTHEVSWRPMPGATIFLDNVIFDAGQTMGFVLGLGDGDAGVWAVHTGSFGQTAAAARDNLTSAAQLRPDEDGLAVAYRLAGGSASEAVGISWWQRQVGNGEGFSASPLLSLMGNYNTDYTSWRFQERVAAAGKWIRLEGRFLTGVPLPGALFVDEFKVEIRTLSWALDTPKLAWTVSPGAVPWKVAEGFAPYASDGRAGASSDAPFETTLTTMVQGPALFALSHIATSANGIGATLSAILNGSPQTPFGPSADSTASDGSWMREAVVIPPGNSTLSLKAQHSGAGGGSWFLDQCNVLTPAPEGLRTALLGAGPGMPVWASQGTCVSRDETTVRADGASARLTPEPGKVSEIVVDVTGPAILSFWAKAEPGATLASCVGSQYVGDMAPYGGGGWEMKNLQVPNGPQHVHLIAGTAQVWIDNLVTIYTVSLAAALDVTSDFPGVSELPNASMDGGAFAAQLPPGSGAVGDDAVIFPTSNWLSLTVPFDTFPARVRFRHLTTGNFGLRQVSSGVHTLYSWAADGPEQWREADLILPTVAPGDLVFAGSGVWFDHLRIDSIEPRPWVDAAIPTPAVPARWLAYDRADRAGGICAVSMIGGPSTGPIPLDLSIPGACDISAVWRRGRGEGPPFGFRCGTDTILQTGNAWQPLHIHMDEAAGSSFFVESQTYDKAWGGEGMVDDVTITPGSTLSFSQAMDTNAASEGIRSPGWTAMGTALASVETGVTFDGVDAIAIRPDPSVPGRQTAMLRATFGNSGFFHLRARRGGATDATCVVKWMPANGPHGLRPLPLSSEWSRLTDCVSSATETTIEIEVSLDGSDPASVVYLDTFAWEATPATGDLLEAPAPAFTNWTSVPANAWTGGCHGSESGVSASAMEVTTLAAGATATLTGTVTGPGFVVFSYADERFNAPYTLEVAVGETPVLSKNWEQGNYGAYVKIAQVFVPGGTHTVSWSVRPGGPNAIGPFRLLSVALVPGTEVALLTARLPSADGWRFGGNSLPQPLYHISEGIVSPAGVTLPAANSWIERDFTGPAEVSLGWYSDTWAYEQEPGRFSVDGQPAGGTYPDSYRAMATRKEITKGVSIPPGVHRFKWERTFNDASTLALGPCVAGPPVISADDVGPVVWVNESTSEYRWKSVTGNAFTGTTALSARDTARGECLITGPGLLSFMLAQDGRSIFRVEGQEGQEAYYFSSEPHGFELVSLLIPPGPQRLTFIESYCEPTDGTEIAWIDDMKFTSIGFAQWRSVATENEYWGANWKGMDSDNDGVTDEYEYAFGTSATTANPAAGPAYTIVDGSLRLQFPTLPYDTTGLRYAVDTSSDLLDWVEQSVVPANGPLATGPTVSLPATPRTFVRTRVLVH